MYFAYPLYKYYQLPHGTDLKFLYRTPYPLQFYILYKKLFMYIWSSLLKYN